MFAVSLIFHFLITQLCLDDKMCEVGNALIIYHKEGVSWIQAIVTQWCLPTKNGSTLNEQALCAQPVVFLALFEKCRKHRKSHKTRIISLILSSLSNFVIVQNAAAKFFTITKGYDHITPVLSTPHWIPADRCTDYICKCWYWPIKHWTALHHVIFELNWIDFLAHNVSGSNTWLHLLNQFILVSNQLSSLHPMPGMSLDDLVSATEFVSLFYSCHLSN